jgi:NAD+ synthase (glutamine-hydrolysing)
MRIALGQFNPTVGDLAGNEKKMQAVYARAVAEGADLLVFGELAVCGYPPEDLLHKSHFLEDSRAAVEKLAAECSKLTIVAGFAEKADGKSYDSAAILQDGGISKIYRKSRLVNSGVFDERRYFEAGAGPVTINTGGLNIAVTICADIWDAEWLENFLKPEGKIQLLVSIAASPFNIGKAETRLEMIGKCAKKLNCAIAYCNLIGGQDELVFDGRSVFADSRGNIICQGRGFEEDLLIADVAAGDNGAIEVTPLGPALPQPMGLLDEVYQGLVLGTRDYARKNGFEKVLLGLSGGIDSSVVAAIATAALGAENVLGITMPSKFNSQATIADAGKVASNLGIRFLTIPIEGILEEFDNSLRIVEAWDNKGTAYENLQARIRGGILMSLSNQLGMLVLTSGNKSETAVGYATLYGDTAGGFAVIKDVPKTMVYKLAEHINKKFGRPLIPDDVTKRPPSAELSEGQRDTDTLPDYDLLDKILKGYVEEDKSARQLIDSGLPKDIVCRVIGMVDHNEYKRRQSPPGVKITGKAFGKDRRLPITNLYSSSGGGR